MRALQRILLCFAISSGVATLSSRTHPASEPGSQSTTSTPGIETWGDNSAGELGDSTLTPSTVPVAADTSAAGSSSVVAMSAGGRHDLALLSNGTVLAWGDDTYGQLGNGLASANGDTEIPTLVQNVSGAVAVAAGGEYSLALLSNGTVEAWGDNDEGQLGDGTKSDSAVPVRVEGLTGVTGISAGDQTSLAVLENRTVEAWGENGSGELGDGSLKNSDVPVAVQGLSRVIEASAGGAQSLALLSNGTAMSWGANENDQLGDGQDVSTQTLSDVPVAVEGLTNGVEVSAGFEDSLALTKGGTVMAWGANGFYQLARPQEGTGGVADSDVPLTVPGVEHVTAIAAGGLFNLALLRNGRVAGWGDDAFGQLGNSSTDTEQQVVRTKGLDDVTAIAAGGPDSLAIASSSDSNRSEFRSMASHTTPWQVLPTENPASKLTDLPLNTVSASSPTDAWAVGSYPDVTTEPTGEHWDGKAWTFASFAPGPKTPSSLYGVDDISSTNAWVVGASGSGTLIEHWDGTDWSVVPSPDPETGPNAYNQLQAISGSNPKDLWAVGTFSDGESFAALLFVHWNGTSWTFFSPRTKRGVEFGTGVTVVSAHDAWAVGDEGGGGTVSAHFDGTSWAAVTTPILDAKDSSNELTAVTNAGADDIWASGFADDDNVNFRTPYLLHWTGKAWSLVTVANTGTEGSLLEGVAALSSADVWAVGATDQTDGGELALTEKFDGKSWSIVPALDPGQLASLPENSLESIAAEGSNVLFTVGSQQIPGRCCLLPIAEEDSTAG